MIDDFTSQCAALWRSINIADAQRLDKNSPDSSTSSEKGLNKTPVVFLR